MKVLRLLILKIFASEKIKISTPDFLSKTIEKALPDILTKTDADGLTPITLAAKYGYEAISVAEPTSFFPGTSNWAIDFQFAILDAMIKNRLQRDHLAVTQRDKVIQKAQRKSAESAGGYAAGNSER